MALVIEHGLVDFFLGIENKRPVLHDFLVEWQSRDEHYEVGLSVYILRSREMVLGREKESVEEARLISQLHCRSKYGLTELSVLLGSVGDFSRYCVPFLFKHNVMILAHSGLVFACPKSSRSFQRVCKGVPPDR